MRIYLEKRNLGMKKKYKAIFGNPPYSIRTTHTSPILLWNKFADSSMASAEEVYYVTPFIWNGRARKFVEKNNDAIRHIDFDITDDFEAGTSICYWNTHPSKDKIKLYRKGVKIEIDRLTDIEYLPYDMNNTLHIHMKGWQKNRIGWKANTNIHTHYNKRLLQRNSKLDTFHNKDKLKNETSDEFRHKVFVHSMHRFFYTNDKGVKLYGQDLFNTPKIIIGASKDNTPYFDRKGEVATTQCAYYLIDTIPNLEIRFKQLQTNFTKFWFATGRQDLGDSELIGLLYHTTFRLFPDIPLHITEDKDIYEWLDLTADDIAIVEKYADIIKERNERRLKKLEMKNETI